MQPTNLHVRGINSLRDLDVDLSAVPPGLCAVVGDNGEGKTTLLECMLPAPVWLTMPTRLGALADSATGRDSLIDLTHLHGGTTYRHVVNIDKGPSERSRPTTEAYLYVDGQPVNDGKLGTYAEQVAKWLPPQHLVLASSFAAQDGAGSFGQLDVHGRRKLFRAMLGLDGLQAMADRATKHRRPLDALTSQLDRTGVALDQDREQATTLDTQLAAAAEQVEPLRNAVAEARTAHQRNQQAHAAAAALLEQLATARAQALTRRQQLEAARDEAADKQATAAARLAEADKVLAQASQITANVAEHATHQDARGRAATDYRVAQADLARLTTAATDATGAEARIDTEITRARNQLQAGLVAGQQLNELELRASDLSSKRVDRPATATAAEAAGKAHREAEETTQRLQQAAVRTLDAARSELERATRDAAALDRVPCAGSRWVSVYGSEDDAEVGDGSMTDCSTCSMLGTAAQARDALPRLRTELEAAEQAAETARGQAHGVAELRSVADEARRALRDLDTGIAELAGADTALDAARKAMAESSQAQARLDVLLADRMALQASQAEHAAATAERRDALEVAEAAGRAAATALDRLGNVAEAASRLAQAQAEAPLLRQSAADYGKQAEQAEQQLALVVVPPEPAEQAAVVAGHAQAVAQAATAAEASQDQLERHLANQGRLRGQRQALGDLEARSAALAADRERVARRRAGWVLLERAFGPEGIQALEIDAAGPGVSDLGNELLQAMGEPYTVQLRTVREATATRKQREIFDVLVHDGRSGTARDLGRMSGGEQVLVNECLKLAISVHVAQHFDGLGPRSLWRDETDKGLSLRRQERYPTMLRLALDRGRFDRCFYITHSPVAAQQADSVLLVRGGKATVLDPASYAEALQAGRV